jgi:hypothetical protein
MRSDTTRHLWQRIHDDPLVSLLDASLGYAVGSVLITAVSPASTVRPSSWIILGAALGGTVLIALLRRNAHVLRHILLAGFGCAGVAVGIAYPLYKATQQPGWLLSWPAVICYAFAAAGAIMLLAMPELPVDTAVPPNTSFERTRGE